MKTLIIFCLFVGWYDANPTQEIPHPNDPTSTYTELQIKLKAFIVLNNKCNICHRKQNSRMVFTLENMEKFSTRIHKQVFIKERMPKGKNNKLSPQESQVIHTWLKNLNIS